MKRWLFVAFAYAGLSSMTFAQGGRLGQSIMFDNPTQDRSDLTTLPPGQKKKARGESCTDMLTEIQTLKGKPQRRSTMAERHRQECERP